MIINWIIARMDYCKDHSAQIIGWTICSTMIIVGIYLLIKSISARWRRQDLELYWDELSDTNGSDNALDFYKKGIHIAEHYHISFRSIGCASKTMYYLAAENAILRRIDWYKSQFNKNRIMAGEYLPTLTENKEKDIARLEAQLKELRKIKPSQL